MIKDILIPRWVWMNGIAKNHKGIQDEWQIAAGDTETHKGVPITLQLCFDGINAEVTNLQVTCGVCGCKAQTNAGKCGACGEEIIDGLAPTRWKDSKGRQMAPITDIDILPTFLGRIEKWARRKCVNVVYFHNLPFDLQALLYKPAHQQYFSSAMHEFVLPLSPERAKRYTDEEEIRIDGGEEVVLPAFRRWMRYLQVFADKNNWWAKLHLGGQRAVFIIDSRAFFPSSLEKAAKLVGSPALKLDRPKGLGDLDLRGDPVFEAYARQDVIAQWYLGKAIYQMHKQNDVKCCVSIPSLASRILRHKFVPENEPILMPPQAIVRAAILSYHGGHNQIFGYALPKKLPDRKRANPYRLEHMMPGWYNCHELDINSAYAGAMTKLPSMAAGEWVGVSEVPQGEDGIVQVSGECWCRYGPLTDHSYHRLDGEFERIWMTTYELDSAIRHGCLKVSRVRGWIWKPTSTSKPFRDYAEYYWGEQAKYEKDTLPYVQAKLLCNSLYGKTVETRRFSKKLVTDEYGNTKETDIWMAGSAFNPALGTWITGRVRAELHDMEHAGEIAIDGKLYPTLHSSTDAIKTMRDPREMPNIGPGLGQWSVEVSGPCLLFDRPKIYVHESFDQVDPKTGKKKVKYAKHGFRGTLAELFDAADAISQGKDFEYAVQHCWSMRQALIRSKKPVVPLNFEMVRCVLHPKKD